MLLGQLFEAATIHVKVLHINVKLTRIDLDLIRIEIKVKVRIG